MAETACNNQGVARAAGVTILQLNCHGSVGAMWDLGERICEEGIQVCLLQEPYAYGGGVLGLPSYMRRFASEDASAVVVVADSEYECMPMNECSFASGVCVWLKGAAGEFLVVSLYCRPKGNLEECLGFLDRVLQIAGGKHVLVGMDANACSEHWHSKGITQGRPSEIRGRMLASWVSGKGLGVLNCPSVAYTFTGARGQSDIDVTLHAGPKSDLWYSWDLRDEWGLSDHNAILIRIRMGLPAPIQQGLSVSERWSAVGCNWKSYEALVAARASSYGFTSFQELDARDKVQEIYSWLREANGACLRRQQRGRKSLKHVAWWTADLAAKKVEAHRKRKAFQKERRSRGQQRGVKWNEWRECVREYKAMMKEAKDKDWQAFVGKEGNADPWGRVYRICTGKGRGNEGLAGLRTSTGWTRTWRESADVFLREFFPPDADPPTQTQEATGDELGVEFEEVREAVGKMRMGKAPGIDGISNEMIRHAWVAVPRFIWSMFSSCLEEGVFPEPWKVAKVVVLLKSVNKDRSEPRSYRPISLLSGLGKVMERIMVGRLMSRMEGRWNDAQYGFREGRSTDDAWSEVRRLVGAATEKHVVGIFVDYKGAFDYLRWAVILDKLREAGVSSGEMQLWRDYFRGRQALMRTEQEEIWRYVERGCPQGSIGGPSVWNLCMNELLERMNEFGVSVVAYADDLLIVVEGKTRVEVERRAAGALGLAYEWGKEVGVQVSAEKTVGMVLRGGLEMLNRPIHLETGDGHNVTIKFVDRLKYLGIVVGAGLDFRAHLRGLRERVAVTVGKLGRVLRRDWGLKRRATSTLIKGLVLAAVMYGASSWHIVMKWKGMRDEINRCQRIALYAASRVCKTVSTEAMQVIAGFLPWDIECVKRATMWKMRKGVAMSAMDLVEDREIAGMDVEAGRRVIEERANEEWQRRWDASGNGRVTYEWIKSVNFAARTRGFEPGLSACYLITGHGSLNSFLFGRNLSDSPDCPCGNGREDWVHVLCECDMYETFRDIEGMRVVRTVSGWDVSGVLQKKDSYDRFCVFAERAFRMRSRVLTEAGASQ